MDIGAILFILGLLGLVAAFVGRPLLEQKGLRVTREDVEFSSLLAQRDHILDALEELDMDRTMKKVDADDYERRRAELMREGAEVLRQLDALNDELDLTQPADDSIEQAIEQQVEALRQARRENQDEQAAAPESTKSKYCPACGAAIDATDRFCTHCGEPLASGVST